MPNAPTLDAIFYITESGHEPVREWLRELGRPASTEIGWVIRALQRRWPLGMPRCRALGAGLFEARVSLSDGREARVFVCVVKGCLYLLHGIIKKTQKTPDAAMRLSRERMAVVQKGEKNET